MFLLIPAIILAAGMLVHGLAARPARLICTMALLPAFEWGGQLRGEFAVTRKVGFPKT
jgi:hypothetical protein